MIRIGINGIKETIVTEETTAKHMLSGQMPVYATPSLVAFVEYTCSESVQSYLEAGTGTVGTRVDIKHIAASPIGANIRCESELIDFEGRKLSFAFKVFDDFEQVAEGRHERFIIDEARFMSKINAKISKLQNR